MWKFGQTVLEDSKNRLIWMAEQRHVCQREILKVRRQKIKSDKLEIIYGELLRQNEDCMEDLVNDFEKNGGSVLYSIEGGQQALIADSGDTVILSAMTGYSNISRAGWQANYSDEAALQESESFVLNFRHKEYYAKLRREEGELETLVDALIPKAKPIRREKVIKVDGRQRDMEHYFLSGGEKIDTHPEESISQQEILDYSFVLSVAKDDESEEWDDLRSIFGGIEQVVDDKKEEEEVIPEKIEDTTDIKDLYCYEILNLKTLLI